MMSVVEIYELDSSETDSLSASGDKQTAHELTEAQTAETADASDNKQGSDTYVHRDKERLPKLTAEQTEQALRQTASLDAAIFPGNVWGVESYRKSTVNSYDYLAVAIISNGEVAATSSNKEAVTLDNKDTAYSTADITVSSCDDADKIYSGIAVADNKESCGSRIAGFALLRCFDDAELIRIAVDTKLRRQGIGDKLLESLLREARTREIHDIFLEVRSGNAPAIGMYEKAGFAKIGVRRGYYTNPAEDAVIMRYTW